MFQRTQSPVNAYFLHTQSVLTRISMQNGKRNSIKEGQKGSISTIISHNPNCQSIFKDVFPSSCLLWSCSTFTCPSSLNSSGVNLSKNGSLIVYVIVDTRLGKACTFYASTRCALSITFQWISSIEIFLMPLCMIMCYFLSYKGHVGVIWCIMNPCSQFLKNVFKLSYVSDNQIGSLHLNTLHQVDLI